MIADFSALTAPQWTIILVALGVCFSFSVYTILDVWKRDYEHVNEKVLWMQICIFVPIFGSLTYLLIGRKRGSKRS